MTMGRLIVFGPGGGAMRAVEAGRLVREVRFVEDMVVVEEGFLGTVSRGNYLRSGPQRTWRNER